MQFMSGSCVQFCHINLLTLGRSWFLVKRMCKADQSHTLCGLEVRQSTQWNFLGWKLWLLATTEVSANPIHGPKKGEQGSLPREKNSSHEQLHSFKGYLPSDRAIKTPFPLLAACLMALPLHIISWHYLGTLSIRETFYKSWACPPYFTISTHTCSFTLALVELTQHDQTLAQQAFMIRTVPSQAFSPAPCLAFLASCMISAFLSVLNGDWIPGLGTGNALGNRHDPISFL